MISLSSAGRTRDLGISVLALAVVPALLLEDSASPVLHTIGVALNWVIWLVFLGDFCWGLVRSVNHWTYVRGAWFELAIILITPPFGVPIAMQGLRTIRVARAARLIRLVRAATFLGIGLRYARRVLVRHHFHYVATVTAATVGLGAVGVYFAESGVNEHITSLGDAVWWACVTVTTVGYGDVAPISTEGRIIAVVLMVTGIGAVGVFTATIASHFLEHDRTDVLVTIEKRLAAIERQLEATNTAIHPSVTPERHE